MKSIVDSCFHTYYGSNPGCVIRNVIPILFFGNLEAYLGSDKRVVSVALNPSLAEFLDTSGSYSIDFRFRGAPVSYSYSQSDYLAYIHALSNYFDYNPYLNWFWHNEKVLRHFNTSYRGIFCKYGPNKKFKIENTALHIDLKAPVATDPVWGKLSTADKTLVNTLYGSLVNDILKYLDPDIIVISTSAQNVGQYFGINHKNALIHKTSGAGGYVDLHVIKSPVSNKDMGIVWGLNRQKPFSGAGMTASFIDGACRVIADKLRLLGLL